jgi:hypothetical protein
LDVNSGCGEYKRYKELRGTAVRSTYVAAKVAAVIQWKAALSC